MCGVEILFESNDPSVAHRSDEAGGDRHRRPVERLAPQHVLLHEALGGPEPADLFIAQLAHVPDEPSQDPQILVQRLRDAIVVVPHDRVGGVDSTHRFEVGGDDRGEQTLGELDVRVAHASSLITGRAQRHGVEPGGQRS